MTRKQKLLLGISGFTVGLAIGKSTGLADPWFYVSIVSAVGFWFLSQAPVPVEKPREAKRGAAPDADVMRVYSVACVAHREEISGNSVTKSTGFRMTLCSGRNEDEAIGAALRFIRDANPGWQISEPAALEITPERLAELGVVLTRDGTPEVVEVAA